jgi:hypothetical protein
MISATRIAICLVWERGCGEDVADDEFCGFGGRISAHLGAFHLCWDDQWAGRCRGKQDHAFETVIEASTNDELGHFSVHGMPNKDEFFKDEFVD